MSSNNRHRRDPRQQPDSSSDVYDDDVIFEDSFQFDDDWDSAGTYEAPARNAPLPQESTPQGTASQLDRLRRSINLGSGARGKSRPARDSDAESEEHWEDDGEDCAYGPTGHRVTSYEVPRRREQRTTPVQPEYDESAFGSDEDEYQVYEQYDDDFSEYDAPRPPARAPRARPQLSVPSIARPSLPPAIANADLVNDVPALGLIGAGVASLAAMAIVVANRADSLAPEFATHVSASGLLEDFASHTALWNLPIMATAFTLMNIAIAWFVSPMDRFASRFVLAGAVVVQMTVWVALLRIL